LRDIGAGAAQASSHGSIRRDQGGTVLRSSLAGQLKQLAGVEATRPVVVSCYLGTDGRTRPRHSELVQAAEQVVRQARAAADALALERDARAAVDADLATFTRLVGDHLVDRGPTRGLAWFGSRELGLAEQIRLPLALPDQGRVGWRPSLLAVEAAVAGHPPLGLLLADRERARLALYQLGELEELPGLIDEVPAHTSGGGRAQARLQRHSDEAAHHHARRAADGAYHAFRGVDGLEVVLAGPEIAVKDVYACLRAELAERVVARLHLPLTSSKAELEVALAEVEASRAADRRAELVDRINREAGSRTVAAGLAAVLEALGDRRVATALAVEGHTAPGAVCPNCGMLALALDCPACQSPTVPVDDAVEPALEEALRQGATVMHVPVNGGLEAVGGVGALLRY
jgi:Bacterial archaeo-eukaryotic release factor family 10